MGSKSIYYGKNVLNSRFQTGTHYFALFTTSPTESSDSGTEVSGGSYARKSVTGNSTNFPNATQTGSDPAKIKNGTDIIFATPSANWGTIVAFGIYDASTSGNLIYWGAITPSKSVTTGNPFKIKAGDLIVSEQ